MWINQQHMSFQRKKKPKEKPVASVQLEEALVKESAPSAQEPPCPAVRKRKRRPLKARMETVTAVTTQKVRDISPQGVTEGCISWRFRITFLHFCWMRHSKAFLDLKAIHSQTCSSIKMLFLSMRLWSWSKIKAFNWLIHVHRGKTLLYFTVFVLMARADGAQPGWAGSDLLHLHCWTSLNPLCNYISQSSTALWVHRAVGWSDAELSAQIGIQHCWHA